MDARRGIWTMILPLVANFALQAGTYSDEPKPADVIEPPAFSEFLVLPLRVHILTASDLPEIDCHLTEDDIKRIVHKVNTIWNVAGIHWGLESIVKEPAANQELFKNLLAGEEAPNLNSYRTLRPLMTRKHEGLHVYYIHKFSVNGVWLGGDYALVQETAKLNPVAGGIDEPIPRVTAHELGHALGLPHRQDRTNLLASGTTGIKLNADEIKRARESARKKPGVLGVGELKDLASKTGDKVKASMLWTWLSEIPGVDGEPLKQVKRLKETRETLPQTP